MAEKNGGTFVPFPAGKPDAKKPGKATTPETSTSVPKPKGQDTHPDLKIPPPWAGGDGGAGWAY